MKSFRSKPLADLWAGRTSRIGSRFHRRILVRPDQLDAALQPEVMNLPGFNFHLLRGKPLRCSVHASGP